MDKVQQMHGRDQKHGGARRHIGRFLGTVLLLMAILHTYIGWRLLPPLGLSSWMGTAGLVFLCCSALLIPLGMGARFLFSSSGLSDAATWVGALLMGLFSSLLVLTIFRDVLLVVLPQTWRGNTALMVFGGAVLVTMIGFVNARRTPRVVEVAVPITGLAKPLQGFTIVQISDLHVGPTIKRAYVEGVVTRVNTLHPDLIVITGDLVDGTVPHLASHIAPLMDMRARHGVYAITGNHEYYSGVDEWIEEFRRLGMQVLLNEYRIIRHDGTDLLVAGITDFSASAFDASHHSDPRQALEGAPDGILPKILLAHQPRSAAAAEQAGYDLQLSGHTHGGQFWPWSLFVPLQQPFTAGLHRLRHLWIYTSRGTGYWGPPKRFGAPSEITLLRLKAED
jgi:predicted MPP superfamily phosphohydrolase